MFRPNLEAGYEALVHDRMRELYPDPIAIRAVRQARRPATGPIRRARRSVGRALVVLGTQVAGPQSESLSGGHRQAA